MTRGFASQGRGLGVSGRAIAQSLLPDSVVNRWPIQAGSGSTLTDVEGGSDLSHIGDPQWDNHTDWIDDYANTFDGVDDGADGSPTAPSGAITLVQTIDFSTDITDIQDAGGFNDAGAATNATRLFRFRGDVATNRLTFTIRDDSESATELEYDLPSTGRYRIGGYIDPASDEVGIVVNGTVQNTAAVTGTFAEQVSTFGLAKQPDNSQRYFGGTIDEPMVANDAWAASQFQDDYDRQPWS